MSRKRTKRLPPHFWYLFQKSPARPPPASHQSDTCHRSQQRDFVKSARDSARPGPIVEAEGSMEWDGAAAAAGPACTVLPLPSGPQDCPGLRSSLRSRMIAFMACFRSCQDTCPRQAPAPPCQAGRHSLLSQEGMEWSLKSTCREKG